MFQQKEFHATPSAQLRELLGQLEAHIGKLEHDSQAEAQRIPALFDAAYTLIVELEHAGASLLAETNRFETAAATFRRKAKLFLRKTGGSEGLAALRPRQTSAPEQWWWFIDQWVAEQNKAQLRRYVKALLTGAVVLALIVGVYVLFLAPDKDTVEKIRLQQAAEQLAQDGDYTAALLRVNDALTLSPDDARLLTFKAILQTQLGFEAEATTTFAAAEAASDSREHFFLNRAQIHLTLGLFEAVLADAEAAIAANPQSVQGYLFMAQANSNLGNFLQAQTQYEEAARLAAETGDAELEAIARIQMAYLYQRISVPTPTAP